MLKITGLKTKKKRKKRRKKEAKKKSTKILEYKKQCSLRQQELLHCVRVKQAISCANHSDKHCSFSEVGEAALFVFGFIFFYILASILASFFTNSVAFCMNEHLGQRKGLLEIK